MPLPAPGPWRRVPCSRSVPDGRRAAHGSLAQPELTAFCEQHGIKLMAYSPLGSAGSYSGASFPARGIGPFACPRGGRPLLQNEVVAEIAARHQLTPAQVLVAWSVQKGFCCLAKSANPQRIAQNYAGAHFKV